MFDQFFGRGELTCEHELDVRAQGCVLGQRHALETIAKRMRTSRAGLENPGRPIGVFMVVRPSGIGKTESALALAEALKRADKAGDLSGEGILKNGFEQIFFLLKN